MRVCKKCRNGIPNVMKLCPHCGKVPPQLFPNFYIYLGLTAVAIGSAVCFRPFAVSRAGAQLSSGMLWISFCIFVVFAIIFGAVCLAVFFDSKRTPDSEKLTPAELRLYKNARRHISAGRHYYEHDEYCIVCGYRRSKKK